MSGEQIKPGYRRTEVGVIPEDWGVVELGSVSAFENGDRSSNYPSPDSFVSSGIPFINAGHVAEGKLDFSSPNYINPEAFHRLTSGKVKSGDILFCLRGSLGKFGVVEDNFGNGAIASSLVIIRPKINKVDIRYLVCYFDSSICTRMIQAFAGGAAQPNLGAQDLAKFLIPLPPTASEQRAIATALSDVDALLTKLDQLIAKKRDLKQATMQQLLTGQIRLPGFSGEWEVKRLGDVASLYQPTTISASVFTKDGHPVYGANGIVGYYHAFNHEEPQVTVTCRGSTCGTVNLTAGKSWITGNAMVVNCDDSTSIEKDFLYQLLLHQDLSVCITGSGQPQIVRGPLANFDICIPLDREEQAAIANFLSIMDAELATLEARRDKARTLKQGMMQELLTGKIRLI